MSFILVDSEEKLGQLRSEIRKAQYIAYDYETYEENPSYQNIKGAKKPIDIFSSKVAGVAYGFENNQYYVSVGHAEPSANFPLSIISDLNKLMVDKVVFCHNLKFELMISEVNDIFFNEIPELHDTMLLAGEFSSEIPLGLKSLAKDFFDYEYEEADFASSHRMNEVTAKETYHYACSDVLVTRALGLYFLDNLPEKALDHYNNVEWKTVQAVARMQLNGIRVDLNRCEKEKAVCADVMKELQAEMNKIAGLKEGETFNPRSTKQLGHILFDVLGMEPVEFTEKGARSTAASALAKLEQKDSTGFIKILQTYRKFATAKSLFLDKLPLFVNDYTGRIHAEFRQSGTSTSRFSSKNPNMQQMRKKALELDDGRSVNIRAIVLPDDEESYIVALDFAGIELRVCAIVTEDKRMVQAFLNGEDLHTVTAQGVFGQSIIKEEDFKSNYRQVAKTMNFLILYGGQAQKLSVQLGNKFDEFECKELIRQWYNTYPGVEEYQDKVNLFVERNRYTETLFGRRRYFEQYDLAFDGDLSEMHRKGFNHIIQGTSADIMKIVMCRIHQKCPHIKMLATVHDELVFSVPKKNLLDDIRKLHREFTDWDFIVPIYSSVSVGRSYGEMIDFELPCGDADFESLEKAVNEGVL